LGNRVDNRDEPAKSIFLDAQEIASPPARAAYLDRRCGADQRLRGEVETLLRHHERLGDYLEQPACDPGLAQDVAGRLPTEGPGSIIGPYKLLEQIGEGGMGVVYMAEQTQPVRRKVALKIIKPGMDSKQVIARFEAERQALALMDHPNIAKVLDAGATSPPCEAGVWGGGRPYFVMELVKGIPITDYCDKDRLSIRERLDLFLQICKAVQHAHQKGIIHRDIKPTNVLITLHDGVPVPKVIDFGIAKATGQQLTEKTLFTAFAQMVGTPLYMSPEQAALSGLDIDTRSDIYSLGVLLYELLTGTTPFDAATFRAAAYDEIRRIIRDDEPSKPSTRLGALGVTLMTTSTNRHTDSRKLVHALRGELDWIVMKALEKDRSRRYETASAFASDVIRYLTDKPVEACPPSAWYRLRKNARRNRVALTTAALIGLALTAGTAVSTWQAIRATRAGTLAGQRQREAQSAAAESKAVLEFLVHDLLGASRPENALGRDVKVADVLANAEKKIDDAFPDQPLVEAGVRHALAVAFSSLSRFDVAYRHSSRSYDLRLPLLGPEHPDTLRSMNILARVLLSQGKHDEARKLIERTLEIRRRVRGPEHPETLESMNDLAIVLKKQGKFGEARKRYEQTLELQRRTLGPEHPDTLRSINNLAIVLRNLGKLDEARTLNEQTLEVRRRVLGPEHPETLSSMHNLAIVFENQGKLDEARTLLEQTLEMRGRVLGPEHSNTLASINSLAIVFDRQGKSDEARKLYERTLEIHRRTLGPDHPDTLSSMHNLAMVLDDHGKSDEARKLNEQILEVRRRVLGPEHPETLMSIEELANVLSGQGKSDEARKLYQQNLEVRRRVLGPEDPHTLLSMHNLAKELDKQGKSDEARKLYERTLEIEGRILGPVHSHTTLSRNSLVQLLLASPDASDHDRAQALELARRGTELNPGNPLCWQWLGVAEYRDGHGDAAIQATERCIKAVGDGGRVVPFLVLALAHARRGEMHQARDWYAKARPALDHGKKAGIPRWLIDEATARLGVTPLPGEVKKEPTPKSASPPR